MQLRHQLQAETGMGVVTHFATDHSPATTDLSVRGLTKRFGSMEILRDVSFSVAKGSVVALIGANGAGKSTLLRCCLRLIEPDEGSIEILGAPLTGQKHSALAKTRAKVGFVFQKHNLSGRLSALSNVVHGAQSRLRGPLTWHQALAPRSVRDDAMEMLNYVGLAHRAMSRADKLSGGQSQRVAIARALMQRPSIIFADEPVASLDPTAGEEVMALLISLARTRGVTVVFTTHNLRHALDYSERIIGLRAGRIAMDDRASSYSAETLRTFYA
ncbi:phosphonate ABC transporter ATP-binding protein [Pseudochelatococcus sp. B33]